MAQKMDKGEKNNDTESEELKKNQEKKYKKNGYEKKIL